MEKYDDFPDEALIGRLRAGEDEIIDYIMEKYKPLVRKKTNAMYLIGGENDDLIQEGMIGLFKAVRDFREDRESSFYHFAELCINRQLYSALEASNRKKHVPLNTYISLSTEQKEDGTVLEELLISRHAINPEQLVIEQEVWKDYQKQLWESLSKLERQVLTLYLEGNPYTHIGELLGKPPKSIDNALQRIRGKIEALEGR